MKTITVAVVGNPNSGKSTLINALAGTALQVGNWPGVTVEKKTAKMQINGVLINLIDLPGTYSLSPYTQEEVIARDFLVTEKPDLILNVVDATNLERNLYLTVQLLELGIPVVIAMNIFDEAKKKGYMIDVEKIEKLLGIKVVPTVATKKDGIKVILSTIQQIAENSELYKPKKLNYGEDIDMVLEEIEKTVKSTHRELANKYHDKWLALKILEGDQLILNEAGLEGNEPFISRAKNHLSKTHKEDLETLLADARYGIAHGVTQEALKKKNSEKLDITERIDKIVLNRYIGIPIFLIVIWLVFKFAFDFSAPFTDWIDELIFGPVTRWTVVALNAVHSPEWLISLVSEGVIAGVGSVLVFIPLIGIIMFILTLLEGSGYMARVAFIMDRVMHAIGLHGKSFIPMILGFGCNVPSIYATRVLETERDRKLTAMLCPLMSCGARLPVYIVIIGAFFKSYSATILWSLYVLGIIMAVVLGFALKKTLYKGFTPVFIMELPPYRLPTFRDLRIHTWQKLKHFVVKAGTYIFAVSVLMWFLLNVSFGTTKENSFLGKTGKMIAPVFEPLGFGTWQASSSLVAGVIAKEVVVSTMAQIYVGETLSEELNSQSTFVDDIRETVVGLGKATEDAFLNLFSGFGIKSLSAKEEEENSLLEERLKNVFSPLAAYSFLVFVLLYWPCIVVGATMKQEFGSWKEYGQAMLIHSIMAYTVAFLIYQTGRLIGL